MKNFFTILACLTSFSAYGMDQVNWPGAQLSLIDCNTGIVDGVALRYEYAVMIPGNPKSGKGMRGALLTTIYGRYPDEADRPRHISVPAVISATANEDKWIISLDTGKITPQRVARYQLDVTHTDIRAKGTLKTTEMVDGKPRTETQELNCLVVAWD